jgi:hypothetical protein
MTVTSSQHQGLLFHKTLLMLVLQQSRQATTGQRQAPHTTAGLVTTPQLLQTELSVARGETAQSNTKFEMLKADYEALNRNRLACAEALEREVSELQAKVADSLAEKAVTQIRLRELEHDKCQLCVQVCTWSSCMLVDLSTASLVL